MNRIIIPTNKCIHGNMDESSFEKRTQTKCSSCFRVVGEFTRGDQVFKQRSNKYYAISSKLTRFRGHYQSIFLSLGRFSSQRTIEKIISRRLVHTSVFSDKQSVIQIILFELWVGAVVPIRDRRNIHFYADLLKAKVVASLETGTAHCRSIRRDSCLLSRTLC